MYLSKLVVLVAIFFFSPAGFANEVAGQLDLTESWYGVIAVLVFIIAYALVIGEEFLHLRKSKPVLVSAGIIWALVGIAYAANGDTHTAEAAVRGALLEYGELMLFLLAAMTYINTMQERNVFEALRVRLTTAGYSYRAIFWITGVLAFFISPVASLLTYSVRILCITSPLTTIYRYFSAINILICSI
jgi:hypothetical protein